VLPLATGFRVRRASGRRRLLAVGAFLGPAVAAVLPALLAPEAYRWPVTVGGGLGLVLWLLSVHGARRRSSHEAVRTIPTVTWAYDEAS
jgi:hypothetical protein